MPGPDVATAKFREWADENGLSVLIVSAANLA